MHPQAGTRHTPNASEDAGALMLVLFFGLSKRRSARQTNCAFGRQAAF